jgi:putative hydrolase of HD superfamily
VPSAGKPYVVTAPNAEVTADQVAGFPAEVGQAVHQVVEEYEAREYQAQGHEDVPPWIETSAAALRSKSARQLAEACQQVPPRQWWKAFAEAYPRLVNPHRQPAESSQVEAGTEGEPDRSEPEQVRKH